MRKCYCLLLRYISFLWHVDSEVYSLLIRDWNGQKYQSRAPQIWDSISYKKMLATAFAEGLILPIKCTSNSGFLYSYYFFSPGTLLNIMNNLNIIYMSFPCHYWIDLGPAGTITIYCYHLTFYVQNPYRKISDSFVKLSNTYNECSKRILLSFYGQYLSGSGHQYIAML